MNNTTVRKTITGLLALSMIVSSASCANSGGKGGSTADKTSEKTITNAYSAVDLGVGSEFNMINSMCILNSNDDILLSVYGESGIELNIANKDLTDIRKVDVEFGKDSNISATALSDGTIVAAVTNVDYGDFKMPDFEDPNFDPETFDYEAMEAAATYSYSVYTIGSDGKVITQNPITGLEKYAEETEEDGMSQGIYFSEMYPCGSTDKVIIGINGSTNTIYTVLGTDGKIQQEIETDEDTWFYNGCLDAEGNLAFATWDESSLKIKHIDCNEFKMSDDVIDLKDTEITGTNAMLTGDGDYTVYAATGTGLYGVKSDGTAEEVINWVDSDLNGEFVRSVLKLSNGDFLMYYYNWSTDEKGFYSLTRRDPSELSSVKVITIATMGSDPLTSTAITNFNKSNTEYRFKLIDYSKYDQWDEETEKMTSSAENQLKMDIVAGKGPDMIMSYSPAIVNTLASKGAFVDLYDYLAKDDTLKKDDIVPTVLNVCETDGKLYTLCNSFGVTTLAAKTKFADKENWTFDDFLETFEKMPKDMSLFAEANGRENIFNYLLAGLDLFDPKTNKCTIDTPEFVKLLEFCNQFEDEEEFDWENASPEEMDKYWNEREAACRNDKALLYDLYLTEPRSYAQAEQGYLGDDMTLVGFPSTNGSGAKVIANNFFAILSTSEYKDMCWDLIKTTFSEENQSSQNMYLLPALKSAFDKRLDDSMKKPSYKDENGKDVEYDDKVYIGDKEFDIKPLTQEERDYLYDYISNASAAYIGNLSSDMISIIQEEIGAYFNGERSAEETAKLIQNRVEIMMSEQS